MLSWMHESSKEGKILFAFYKYLISFRKTRAACRGTTRDTLEVLSSDENVICFERKHKGDHIMIVLNFSKQPVSFTPSPKKNIKAIFSSASAEWGGPATGNLPQVDAGQSFELFPQSATIFEI